MAKKARANSKSNSKRITPKKTSRRERINTGTDTRYVRRDEEGKFKESDDLGKSLRQDRVKKAKRKVKSGHGDRGDRG